MPRRPRFYPRKQPSSSPSRLLLRATSANLYAFAYRFPSGQTLTGTVVGDSLENLSDQVFNLRHLSASAVVPGSQGRTMVISFDQVYGQFKLNSSEVLLLGSNPQTGSFFSFNYRGGEASLYDAVQQRWVASGWVPEAWCVTPRLPQTAALGAAYPPSGFSSTIAAG